MKRRGARWLAAAAALLAALVAFPHPEREAGAPRRSTVLVTDALSDAVVAAALEAGGVLLPYSAAPDGTTDPSVGVSATPTANDVRRVRGERSKAHLWVALERPGSGEDGRALLVTSPGSDLRASQARGALSPDLCERWAADFVTGRTPSAWAAAPELGVELVVGGAPSEAWDSGLAPPGWTLDGGHAQDVVFAPGVDAGPGGFRGAATRPTLMQQRVQLPRADAGTLRELALEAWFEGSGASVRVVLPGEATLTLAGGTPGRRVARLGDDVEKVRLEVRLPEARRAPSVEGSAVVAGVSLIVRSAPDPDGTRPR